MPLYTKTGDQGQTSLYDGRRVSKDCPRVVAYGTVDELNAHIGLLRSLHPEPLLEHIQNDLFAIGAILSSNAPLNDIQLDHQKLEHAIDQLAQPFRGFVLPGGCNAAAQAHICRTVCRRAEREVVTMQQCTRCHGTSDTTPTNFAADNGSANAQIYLNRLSDYLFALALHINELANTAETYYKKNR